MARTLPILTRDTAVVLVIDVQEKLMPAIHEAPPMLAATGKLLQASRILNLPILATEQYPAGLGPTVESIRQCWGSVKPVEKLRFSACVEGLCDQLSQHDRPHVIVAGVEAHVCVQQTVLDLLRRGYTPYICADAVSARRSIDRDIAIERLRDAGAIITTAESVIFEIVGHAVADEFKQLLKLIK